MAHQCDFSCKRCGYTTPLKSNLKLHLRRKVECTPSMFDIDRSILMQELEGEPREKKRACVCGKTFTTRQALYYHRKTFKCEDNIHIDDDDIRSKVEELEREIKRLKQGGGSTTTINNTQNNIQNNIMINLQHDQVTKTNEFGKETLAHLDPGFLKSCLLKMYEGMKDYVSMVHFNPDVPENHNIRFKSTKNKTMDVFRHERWEETNHSSILDELIARGYKVLNHYYISNKTTDADVNKYQNEIQDWLWKMSLQNGIEYWKLRKDVCLLIKNSTIYTLAKTD